MNGIATAEEAAARDRGELIRAARLGDQAALNGLLVGAEGYLRSVAFGMTADRPSPLGNASSLVQETYVRALREFGKFRGRTEPEFLAWVRQILIYHCLKLRRRPHVPKPLRGDESLDSTPSAHAIRREESVALKAAMEQLPDDRRRVVELRGEAALGWDEVGHAMGRSADAARVLYQRAMIQLYGLLGTDDERNP